ncbi:MAG: PQQ-binding-like beta-propeller repeat protein [Fuerstiella sp.]
MSRLALVLFITLASASVFADPAADRRFIAADSSRKTLAIIAADGTTEWQRKIGPLHDLHVLPNGNVLFQDTWTHVLEVNPKTDQTIWEYDSKDDPANEDRRIEIHAFQRLSDGSTMIVESGSARILEVSAAGDIVKKIPLKVTAPHPHRDTRLVRKLDNGHYLACHEGDGVVREYSPTGKVVWEYEVPLFGRKRANGHGVYAFGNQCFSALRLNNGNTLIGTGNGHSVLEVTPAGQVVWSIHQNDLPGIQLAWVTSVQFLPKGQILINNCHAGPDNPQLIIVDRNKNVVWQFKDFERFGDALTNSIILN